VALVNWLFDAVGSVLVFFHSGLAQVFGEDSGLSWGLSIVLLVVAMRLLLFPLFVKQIRSQRAMQVLQPKMKALQAKHKGDRETLNREMMALYKEHGANPLSGCLPILLQLPIFLALFQVLNSLKPRMIDGELAFTDGRGVPQDLVESAGRAEFFGTRISAAFNSNPDVIRFLDASVTATRVSAVIMIVLMGLTTFITQKQLIARAGAVDPQQQMIQRILLYVLPFSFAIFGFQFPLGVLLYWLTTNIWSMGQQYFVIKRMPPPPAADAKDTSSVSKNGSGKTSGKSSPKAEAKPDSAKGGSKQVSANGAKPGSGRTRVAAPAGTTGPGGTAPARAAAAPGSTGGPSGPPGPPAPPPRPKAGPGSKTSRAKRKKGRRGGRI
jgi:YidC/Oxa1 family membrane protein insertase